MSDTDREIKTGYIKNYYHKRKFVESPEKQLKNVSLNK